MPSTETPDLNGRGFLLSGGEPMRHFMHWSPRWRISRGCTRCAGRLRPPGGARRRTWVAPRCGGYQAKPGPKPPPPLGAGSASIARAWVTAQPIARGQHRPPHAPPMRLGLRPEPDSFADLPDPQWDVIEDVPPPLLGAVVAGLIIAAVLICLMLCVLSIG